MKNEKDFFSSMIYAIDSRIDDLQKEHKEYEGCIFVSNEMLKIQKIIPLVMFLMGVVVSFFTDGYSLLGALLYGGSAGLIGSLPVVLISTLYFGITKKYYNKKVRAIDDSIRESLDAKQMTFKEQEKTYVEKITSSLENEVISYTNSQRKINDNKKIKIKKLSLRK